MFVDIGLDKNAFLHYWDAIPVALDAGVETVDRSGGKRKKAQKRITANDIPKPLPARLRHHRPGDQGPHRHQGPAHHHQHQPAPDVTSSSCLSIRPERHLASKIEDPKERQRLRRILN